MDRWTWRKSSYSGGNGGNCVEACSTDKGAAMRDTQNRSLGYLEASQSEWSGFLQALKAEQP
ncbi:DUF397 domain-containing protein [Nocardiopsis alba]|uniref:DUF397 domain-containing protein n=1 Tax=Nocardiopsis alba TaxID=53437 RepID=UPI0033BC3EA9